MGDTMDHDAPDFVFDGIEHAIGTDAETIRVRIARELFCLRGSGVVNESFDSVPNARRNCRMEMAELTSCCGRVGDVIQDRYASAKHELSPWGSAFLVGGSSGTRHPRGLQ